MKLTRVLLLWVIVLAGGTAVAAPATNRKPAILARPNIVLVTLDTTRADRMGFLGSDRGLTPNLDALARESAVFSHAYAHVPLTTPSHATILTGTYPQFNHVNYLGDPLNKTVPYLPEILHRNGYKTGAFVGALVLDPKKLAPGFERGFDVYDAGFHRRRSNEDHYRSLERRGEEVVGHALAWLSKQPKGPFFLWVHLYDPHDPYSPPEPYKTRYQAQPYDGEIAYTDAMVSKLFVTLRERGLFDSTLVAVMADHGEAFGEHGENHHGIFLYDETIHVPLLIKLPGQRSTKNVASRVGLVDLMPTALQVAHLPVPSSIQGQSLLAVMKSASSGASPSQDSSILNRPAYAESSYGHLSFGWSKLQALRTGKYLYIEAPERELYDQAIDAPAAHNVAPNSKAVTETAAAEIADFYQRTKTDAPARRELTPEQTESLHALGYMSSDADADASGPAGQESGADPKSKIGIANLLYQALVATENEEYQEAVPLLEKVLKQEPNTPVALLQLGRAHMALKQYQDAVAPFEDLVKRKPDDSFAHYELGCALVKTGHWTESTSHFEAAVSQMDSSAMMHFYLALVYQRNSRSSEAEQEFQKAVRLHPDNFPANLLLGRLLLLQNRFKEALPYLLKAVKLRNDSIDAHGLLSDTYRGLGNDKIASRELVESQRIRSQGGTRLGTPTEDDPSSDLRQR